MTGRLPLEKHAMQIHGAILFMVWHHTARSAVCRGYIRLSARRLPMADAARRLRTTFSDLYREQPVLVTAQPSN